MTAQARAARAGPGAGGAGAGGSGSGAGAGGSVSGTGAGDSGAGGSGAGGSGAGNGGAGGNDDGAREGAEDDGATSGASGKRPISTRQSALIADLPRDPFATDRNWLKDVSRPSSQGARDATARRAASRPTVEYAERLLAERTVGAAHAQRHRAALAPPRPEPRAHLDGRPHARRASEEVFEAAHEASLDGRVAARYCGARLAEDERRAIARRRGPELPLAVLAAEAAHIAQVRTLPGGDARVLHMLTPAQLLALGAAGATEAAGAMEMADAEAPAAGTDALAGALGAADAAGTPARALVPLVMSQLGAALLVLHVTADGALARANGFVTTRAAHLTTGEPRRAHARAHGALRRAATLLAPSVAVCVRRAPQPTRASNSRVATLLCLERVAAAADTDGGVATVAALATARGIDDALHAPPRPPRPTRCARR
ncbi:hypothetical protein KFE25_002140 [Diacronema lutheri]|uniref:Uncharacterized protein n=1 Tax=Diacronema lutheri TaxID=2081491 RepID=A0A8J5XTR2_DIALT|nr:hypothetical protein KFE25_002140 [Diacronema lutheri]